jgi:ferredoxin--NADP+ reductase
VEEVVVAGRRGPAQSAFTLPELIGLASTPGVDLLADPAEVTAPGGAEDRKLALLRALPAAGSAARRIRLRYGLAPMAIRGTSSVQAVEFERRAPAGPGGDYRATGALEKLDTGFVLSSIGYRGVPIAGLPFHDASGTIPNRGGRVFDPVTGRPLPGTYVAGWIKRGPTGFIGTNRSCAQETVRALVEDWSATPSSRVLPARAGTLPVAA